MQVLLAAGGVRAKVSVLLESHCTQLVKPFDLGSYATRGRTSSALTSQHYRRRQAYAEAHIWNRSFTGSLLLFPPGIFLPGR